MTETREETAIRRFRKIHGCECEDVSASLSPLAKYWLIVCGGCRATSFPEQDEVDEWNKENPL